MLLKALLTLTGFNADYRLRLRTDAIEELVMCLLNEFVGKKKNFRHCAIDSRVTTVFSSYDIKQFASKYKLDEKVIDHLVNDLAKNQGEVNSTWRR